MARKDWVDHGHKMADDPSFKEFGEIYNWLSAGNLDELEFASQVVAGFPHGRDGYFGTPWIVHAVSSSCVESVTWMIEKGVNLNPVGTDGYPPLLACVEQSGAEKYQILEYLISSGADINKQGINGWTPLHMAALKDDERSMRMLLTAGADRTITTQCDDNSTAEEEARNLGHLKSADFIASFSSD